MDVNVYQHFRKDEHPFIDRAGEWIEQVESQYAPYLTSFLDPRQEYILQTLLGQSNESLKVMFFGGYEAAERKKALIYPDYYEPNVDEFELTIFEIKYPQKFGTLSHGKVLGTMLSTGLKREFFGDIISDGQRWQVIVSSDVQAFIVGQVEKIGKVSVRLIEQPYYEIITPKDDWNIEVTTITSFRLDNLVSSVYNISRQRSKQLIEAGRVKVNWSENQHVDYQISLLDIVSVRGFGRFQIRVIEGKTKKERHRVTIGVLRKEK